jgi:hypothetical protein
MTIITFCTRLAVWYPRGEGRFAPRDRHLLPLHPIQRAANVQRPDVVVQHLQPVSATEHPEFVLVHQPSCVPVVEVGRPPW